MAIKVKAKMMGIYKGHRKREGSQFTVESEAEIARWMERLDGKPHPKGVKPAAAAPVATAPRTMSQLNAQDKAAEDSVLKGKVDEPKPVI